MIYRVLLSILFFSISFNMNAFSQDFNLPSGTFIPVILDGTISTNSSVKAKINVEVIEDITNVLDEVVIPKYSIVTCKVNETKRLKTLDAFFISCQQLFLPSGQSINISGNIFDKDKKSSVSTEKNRSVERGTNLFLKIAE